MEMEANRDTGMNGSQVLNNHLEASSYLHREAAADSDDVEMASASPNNNASAEDLDDRHRDEDASRSSIVDEEFAVVAIDDGEIPPEDADDRDVSDISDDDYDYYDNNVPHDKFVDTVTVSSETILLAFNSRPLSLPSSLYLQLPPLNSQLSYLSVNLNFSYLNILIFILSTTNK